MKLTHPLYLLFLLLVPLTSFSQSLDDYIQLALTNNLELAQQEIRYQEAEAQLDQAKALFWPQLVLLHHL
mgnify:FL=1